MNTIVIYHSQTGFTKRYAQWIAEAAGAECAEFSAAKKKDFGMYGAVVFGSWACAGGISRLGWFKSNIDRWRDKKLIVFCVGASPMEAPDLETNLRRNFTEAELNRINVFYCPGGLNYEKMPVPSKLAMKTLIAVLKAKKNRTKAEQDMVRMISESYDISDRKYIEPIIKCLDEKSFPD